PLADSNAVVPERVRRQGLGAHHPRTRRFLLSRETLWFDERLGSCRRGGNLVPTAGRRFCGGRLIGLRHSRKSLRAQFGAVELLRVKSHGDLVALVSGILVAAFCRQREPFVGFSKVALNPDAASVQDREIVLAIDDAVDGSAAEPLRRRRIVRLAVDTS